MDGLEIAFDEHPTFSRTFSKFARRYPRANDGYRHLKNLLSIQFHPQNPDTVLTPRVLHPLQEVGPNIEAFKVTMNIKGLSQGQSPRVCLWLRGNLIIFLCFGSHIEDYKHGKLIKLVRRRIKEIDPDIQF